ncbi:MAG: LysR family transcriptional regulator [Hydrococcus sp. Prado102]|jgi:DNA-binding transcriptional LysR family regulator|nr:LysR family transcriptional regulator [Hydrococcus sp. Prado102]
MVNLEWYRSFVAVYRVGTVSGAAQILYLTQPAVSQHIASLESALSTPLFERMPRRMLPTEAGKRLYNQAIAAIETLEAIATQNTFADAPSLIRLGTPQDFFSEWLVKCLPQNNKTLFSFQFGLVQELIEKLLTNQLDYVVATQKIPKSELEYQPIFEESFWLVGSPQIKVPVSPEILQVDLTPLEQWLKEQPLIAYSEELPIIRRFWRVVFGRRTQMQAHYIIPDLRGIRSAIAQGLGYSVLPDYLCSEWVNSDRLTLILKPTKAVTNQIWLAYRKSEKQSQQTMQLFKYFVNYS